VKNLYTRTITGIIFVAVIIGSMILHPLAFAAVIFVILAAAILEFYNLSSNNTIQPQKITGIIIGGLVFSAFILTGMQIIHSEYLTIIPILILVPVAAELFRNRPNAVQNIAFTVFPILYLSIPLSAMVLLISPMITKEAVHWHILFSFFIILWANDTFAYLSGMWLGKHKFFERISPKKTWEGTTGGLVFGLVAGYVMSVFFKELTVIQWLIASLIIIVTGTLGDLSESLLKRTFGVKDSGNFFPGHGGVLDRFDSVLFAAPALFCYLILLGL
jgi:phosphatidate cytidylyltransferase